MKDEVISKESGDTLVIHRSTNARALFWSVGSIAVFFGCYFAIKKAIND